MLLKILFLFAIAIKQSQTTDAPQQRALGGDCTLYVTKFGLHFNKPTANNLINMYNVSKGRFQNKIRYAAFCSDRSHQDIPNTENTNEKKDAINDVNSVYLIINGSGLYCDFEDVSPKDDFSQEILIDDSGVIKRIKGAKIYAIEDNLFSRNSFK